MLFIMNAGDLTRPRPLDLTLCVQIAYNLLARFVYQRSSNALWRAVQPVLKQQLTFFESIFGQPATFTPSTTHVILVAILLALVVHLDAVRRAVAARR